MKKIVATSLVTGETIEFYDYTAPEQRFRITPSERQRVAHRMIFGPALSTARVDDASVARSP